MPADGIGAAPFPMSTSHPAYPSSLLQLLGDAAPAQLTAIGSTSLLQLPLLGFFCSRKAPGNIILRTYDWAREARDAGIAVIGGFQSTMERECLDFLLRGAQPVVVCPARGIGEMRIPGEWRGAIEEGRLLVVSPFADRQRRMTAELAAERNRLVAAVAERVLIAHAAPGGALVGLAAEVVGWGKPLLTFEDPANAELFRSGAAPAPLDRSHAR